MNRILHQTWTLQSICFVGDPLHVLEGRSDDPSLHSRTQVEIPEPQDLEQPLQEDHSVHLPSGTSPDDPENQYNGCYSNVLYL